MPVFFEPTAVTNDERGAVHFLSNVKKTSGPNQSGLKKN